MLHAGYFLDAFILHAESIGRPNKTNPAEKAGIVGLDVSDLESNWLPKGDLHLRFNLKAFWGKIKDVLKFQPLDLIREYFGEYVAFYFAWFGTLIGSLWFPSFFGLIFFIVEISGDIKYATSSINATKYANILKI
jgi:hypothetical protein